MVGLLGFHNHMSQFLESVSFSMYLYGLSRWLTGKEAFCRCRRCGFHPCGGTHREDPLEKEMATYSSILAWEISWTEEPGGLQPMGLQKSQTRLSDYSNNHLICFPWLVGCTQCTIATSL